MFIRLIAMKRFNTVALVVLAAAVASAARVKRKITGPTLYWEHFEEVGKLGEGAMAVTMEYKHRWLKRRFAAKLPKTNSKNSIASLSREKTLLATFSGVPNVMQLTDVEGAPEGAMMVDLYNAGSFGKWYSKRRPNDFRETREIARRHFSQMVAAVDGMIKKGWAHNDLKDDNVMIHEDPETLEFDAYIIDIGENTARRCCTPNGFIWGGSEVGHTAAFPSPEKMSGKFTPAADFWAIAGMFASTMIGHSISDDENFRAWKTSPEYPGLKLGKDEYLDFMGRVWLGDDFRGKLWKQEKSDTVIGTVTPDEVRSHLLAAALRTTVAKISLLSAQEISDKLVKRKSKMTWQLADLCGKMMNGANGKARYTKKSQILNHPYFTLKNLDGVPKLDSEDRFIMDKDTDVYLARELFTGVESSRKRQRIT